MCVNPKIKPLCKIETTKRYSESEFKFNLKENVKPEPGITEFHQNRKN